MPPRLALLLTIAFVFYLFRRDLRQRPNVTGALWLPFVWMVLIRTRSPTQWLHILHFPISLGTADEGNPLDALIYFILILVGLWVLNQRQIHIGEVIRNNGWLVLFLVYCFIAISWSDFPLSSFKRWIKSTRPSRNGPCSLYRTGLQRSGSEADQAKLPTFSFLFPS